MEIILYSSEHEKSMKVNLLIPPQVGDKIELMYDPDEPKPEWIIECDDDLWEKVCEDGFVVTERTLYDDKIECTVTIWG